MSSSVGTFRSSLWWVSFGLVLAVSGCGQHSKPNTIFMPDMVYSPALKAQEGQPRLPVQGTIPRGFTVERMPESIDQAGGLQNPLPRTVANLEMGRKYYDIYCIVCHGPTGMGDGNVVPKFPQPPSLQSDKIKGYSDGKLYYVMTNGQNLMPSYAPQTLPEQRWAIVHYIRALHKAKSPSDADVKAATKMGAGG